jgi:hypothetical protein
VPEGGGKIKVEMILERELNVVNKIQLKTK